VKGIVRCCASILVDQTDDEPRIVSPSFDPARVPGKVLFRTLHREDRVLPLVFRLAAMLALWLGWAGQAAAGPLNPLDFASLGPFPTEGGTFTFTTGPFPVLEGPGTAVNGVVVNGVAVFDFSSITVASNQVFTGTGDYPLTLLSRGDITIKELIDVSGTAGGAGGSASGSGGPGGGAGNSGSGSGGGPGGGFSSSGGGFGGRGGAGGAQGGAIYSDLTHVLQGGSGGGPHAPPGGGGGGSLEVGAIGTITVGGNGIRADGGAGAGGGGGFNASGGGSGGGILIHANTVTLTSILSDTGGRGGVSSTTGSGGGGGGGRVVIEAGLGGFQGLGGLIDVSGGDGNITHGTTFIGGGGGGDVLIQAYPGGISSIPSVNLAGGVGDLHGAPGSFTISTIVPEPASVALLATGVLCVVGSARYASRSAAARAGFIALTVEA
jgi:hypothetical protein